MKAAIFCLLLTFAASAQAEQLEACLDGVCFQPADGLTGESLPLRGIGTYRYLLFSVYTAAFYAPASVNTAEEALADVPKVLVLHYRRSIAASDIAESSEALLRGNPEVDGARITDKLRELHASYSDVGPGDRYALVYRPQSGSTLYLNGRKQVEIQGADFASAYFGIWLSRFSMSGKLTKALLGQS